MFPVKGWLGFLPDFRGKEIQENVFLGCQARFTHDKMTGNTKSIKHVLLAEAQHRRLHSAFGWVRPNCLVLRMS